MVAISHCTWKSYLESKEKSRLLHSLRRNSLVSLCPTIMVVQFVKVIFYCFLLAGESWILVQLGYISLSPLPPMKKQLVSPFSSLFHIVHGQQESCNK